MQNAPVNLINSTAEYYDIALENGYIDCLLFVYAHVLQKAENRLIEGIVNEISIIEIETALDNIHYTLVDLKESGQLDEDDRRYSDIEDISPILETAIPYLKAMKAIYADTLLDPRRRREKMGTRNDAIVLFNQNSLACRRYIIEINRRVEWWREEEQAANCQNFRAAG